MSDPLFATILENPDDDAARLVYADWLEEHGQQERGELIRVQCERARLPDDDDRQRELFFREEALLAAHGKDWLGKLKPLVKECRYERGFVAWVSLPGRAFLEKAEKLFALAPLRGIQLTHLGMGKFPAADLAAVPQLARLRSLQLRGAMRDAPTRTVLQSPHVQQLERLHLEDTACGEGTIRHLWAKALPQLQTLEFYGEGLSVHAELLSQPKIPLREYAVTSMSGVFHRDRVIALARTKALAGLTHLNLRNSPAQVPGATALANSKVMSNLRELVLRSASIGVTGMGAIAASPHMANLTTLNVRTNHFGINGLRALVESQHLTKLNHLELGNNDLDARAVPLLRGWSGLARVRSLDLSDNQIPDGATAEFLRAPELANLWHLSLGNNPLGREAAQVLLTAPHLDRLCSLQLQNTGTGAFSKRLQHRFGDRVTPD